MFGATRTISRLKVRLNFEEPRRLGFRKARIRTLDQVIAESTTRTNFNVFLLSIFAAVALSLAALGIYGLMSYAVEQRTQEIGIPMALGADQSTIMRLVLGQSMKLSAIGTGLGLLAALGLTWFLGRLLFAVKPIDPLVYAAVVVILAALALFAAFVPARRAVQVDPMLSLRRESFAYNPTILINTPAMAPPMSGPSTGIGAYPQSELPLPAIGKMAWAIRGPRSRAGLIA